MHDFIVPFDQAGEDGLARLGGKGAALWHLRQSGFPVPAGFVITTAAFRQALGGALLCGCEDTEELRARILAAPLPADLRRAITQAYTELTHVAGERVAVRSSATLEDGRGGSMAGLAWSEINVTGIDAVLDAVKRVWASLFRPEVLLYDLIAERPAPPEMAVIVQQLVPADVAGVMFTANPVTRDRRECLISATYGLGQAVVDGDASDTFALDRISGALRRSRLGQKAWRVRPAEGLGIVRERISGAEAHAPALDDRQLEDLCSLARRVEAWAGAPQDVEFALWHGRIFVLQARPVTGVAKWNGDEAPAADAAPKGRTVLWSNANVSESLPGVATPLTWSIIRGYARDGFLAAFRGLGLSIPREYAFVGAVRGRVYLNLTEFLSVAGQIPFLSPGTLLHLGGVSQPGGTGPKEAAPEGTKARKRRAAAAGFRLVTDAGDGSPARYVEITRLKSTGFLLRLPATALKLAWSNLTTPVRARRSMRGYRRTRDELLHEDLDRLPRPALGDRLQLVTRLLDERGHLLLEVSSNFLASYIACREAIRLRTGGDQDLGALVSGVGNVASAEPGLRLLDLAHRARRSPELSAAVRESATPDDLRARLAATDDGRSFVRAVEDFLARYGLRAAREAEISTPRWREDPGFVLDVLRRHLEAATLPETQALLRDRRRVREETTERVLGPVDAASRRVLALLLEHARGAARLREELRTEVIEVLGLYRRVFLAAGRRLVDDHVTARVDDVFYLTMEEVRSYLEGAIDPCLGLRAAARRAQSRAFEDAPAPPDSFLVREGEPAPDDTPPPEGEGPLLTGTAASPGCITGRVRIVEDPLHAPLRHGEILVARQADAGWTPLFLVAGAVVLETGGPLSHACVIAREYGVPVITCLSQATRRLHDGDLVVVDADRGVVRVVEYGAAALQPEAVGSGRVAAQ
ncbi:MAG TPA: PEP/pyruvate-binding domain-containing protein [Polyangia bacterium]